MEAVSRWPESANKKPKNIVHCVEYHPTPKYRLVQMTKNDQKINCPQIKQNGQNGQNGRGKLSQ